VAGVRRGQGGGADLAEAVLLADALHEVLARLEEILLHLRQQPGHHILQNTPLLNLTHTVSLRGFSVILSRWHASPASTGAALFFRFLDADRMVDLRTFFS
jgi:hypothetical protein